MAVGDTAGAEEGEGGEGRWLLVVSRESLGGVAGGHLVEDVGDEVDEVARAEQHDEVAGFKGQIQMLPRLFRASGESEFLVFGFWFLVAEGEIEISDVAAEDRRF